MEERRSDMEGSCEYIGEKSSRGLPTRGGHPAWGLGESLTTPRRKKCHFVKHPQLPQAWINTFIQLCVDGRIILKWIFRKLDGGMDWIDLAQNRDTWRGNEWNFSTS